jgi:hypothetical protein
MLMQQQRAEATANKDTSWENEIARVEDQLAALLTRFIAHMELYSVVDPTLESALAMAYPACLTCRKPHRKSGEIQNDSLRVGRVDGCYCATFSASCRTSPIRHSNAFSVPG